MPYIDVKHLFKCETCRHHDHGGCDTWCDHGECYKPNMSKIPKFIAPRDVRCSECKHLKVVNESPIYAVCEKERLTFLLWEADTREHSCTHGERKE